MIRRQIEFSPDVAFHVSVFQQIKMMFSHGFAEFMPDRLELLAGINIFNYKPGYVLEHAQPVSCGERLSSILVTAAMRARATPR